MGLWPGHAQSCCLPRQLRPHRASAGVEFAEAHPAFLCTSLSADNVMQITGCGLPAPPWSAEETDACFIVRDANGQALAYVYYEQEPGRRAAASALPPPRRFRAC
jgi:hypothetical protein